MQKDIKRQRSENWLNEDRVILKDLVKERIDIIANKNTHSNTNKRKENAWNEILNRFNNVCTGALRTLPQIKAQWGLMKLHAKKARAEKTKELTKTDGAIPSQPESNDIPIWMPIEVKVETNDCDEVVSTPDFPGPSGVVEVKAENSAGQIEVKVEKPPSPIVRGTSISQEPILCSDSNDQWWCSDSNDNTVNSDVKSTHEGSDKKNKTKKIVNTSAAQSPAVQVAAFETKCRRELHEMQMKIASLQAANEEHKSRILHLEEEVQYTRIEYYKKKIKFLSNEKKQ